jgi:hypothetical protein
VVDADLTVRQVRRIAGEVDGDTSAAAALQANGIDPGRIELSLSLEVYRELRRRASVENRDPDEMVSEALEAYLVE